MGDNTFPWPKKGDQLFKSDIDWWHNACLNYLSDHWDVYTEGYRQSADLLVDHIKETRSNQDLLVYPIIFLYRQYIELRLKILIRDGKELLDLPGGFPKHHKIDELWRECRIILEKVWPEGPEEDLIAVEECINQFSKKDPTSMAFRYPTDKNGNPHLSDVKYINLRNLSEVMARLAALLDGSSDGVSEFLSCKREMESEYTDEF